MQLKARNRYFLLVCAALVVALTVARDAPAFADAASERKLLADVDAIAKKVSKIRGLSIKKSIRRGVMSKKQITKRLLARVDQEYSPSEIAAEELAMKRFGMLPADTDYKKLVIDLLTDQIAGFYDPWERQLYIADWMTSGIGPLMAHEIDHALQDQHFDLRKLMKPDKNNADAMVARQSLVEGDGTALMLEFAMKEAGLPAPWGNEDFIEMIGPMMAAEMGSLDKVPLILREGLIFPYMVGLEFVAHFLRHHDWGRIDKIFMKPPLSTEQVLHPKKYEDFEKPVVISESTPKTLSSYRKVYDNVSGEFGIRLFLREHGLDEEKANRAAMGWGGDRIVVYVPPGHKKGSVSGTIGVLYTIWDDEADAIEFFEAQSEVLGALIGGRRVASRDTYLEFRDRTGAISLSQRRGDAVLLIVGAPPARASEISTQVWDSYKR